MIADGGALLVASGSAAAFVVVWATTLFSLRREGVRDVLLALLIIPAPVIAWRAGASKRAIAMVVLAVLYAIARVAFG